MLTASREGHRMPPNSRARRRAACAVTVTAFVAPVLVTMPARADDCSKPHDLLCNPVSTKTGTSGGGTGGTGGNSGPIGPPPLIELTDNEAVDAVPGANTPLVAAPPTTFELVEKALSAKSFPAPQVHTAPDGKTYVRMKTALWVDNFEVVQTAPVSAGDQTVQATAKPESVTWDLGESKLTCNDAGTKDGKTCHYRYRRASAGQPGGKYEITATITWSVTWTCEGTECDSPGGDLGEQTMTSPATPLVVSEIQTNTGQ